MDAITILIVDDHTLFRTGMRKMLEAEPDMRVVGERPQARRRWSRRANSCPMSSSWISKCPILEQGWRKH